MWINILWWNHDSFKWSRPALFKASVYVKRTGLNEEFFDLLSDILHILTQRRVRHFLAILSNTRLKRSCIINTKSTHIPTFVANRAFPLVGPRTWNNLPDDVTSAESLSTFRQRLKTHLFTKSFFWLFPGLDFTLSSGPSSSLYYLGHFRKSRIDWLIDWLVNVFFTIAR